MRVHTFEHAPFENAGKIADWARARGHILATTRLDLGEDLPTVGEVDLLVVMGGAMNVYQYRDYPWLPSEKRFIAEAVAARKAVLGVCLGAQLLADVLGARVYQNAEKEIGWFPVQFIYRLSPFDRFPAQCTVFHWHGDTFDLPPGARRIAQSDACANQGFIHGDRLVGLQFHVEVSPETVAGFVAGGEEELQPALYVQPAASIRAETPDLSESDAALEALLDTLAGRVRG
jgi:GMP synthase-like glutamine amidotransferase